MLTARNLLALTLLICTLSIAAQPQPRRMAPADILRVATVSDPQISPGGEWVVYSVSATDGDQTVSNLWLTGVGERLSPNPPTSRQPEPRRNWDLFRNSGRPLLPPGWNGSNPRWSPDGKSVAFLS